MSKNTIFKNLQDAVEYLYSEQIEADIIALPPEVDELTDEEYINDEETGILNVADLAGYVEIEENVEQSDDEDNIPLARLVPEAKKMRQDKQQKPIANWSKVIPQYVMDPTPTDGHFIQMENNLKKKLSESSAVDLFEQFFDEDVYDMILEETKRYAITQKNRHGFTITKDDLKIFMGFLIYSGYHTLPSERDYWSEDDDLGQPIVKNAFSRNAYLEIKSHIHFADNTKAMDNKNDRYFKIRTLFEKVNKNFRQFGVFQENLSIDEMMVRYYGRHSLKQFIRSKPIRFGYKLWAMCGNDGYCFTFSLYAGKDSNQTTEPLGTRAVLDMLSIVENPKNHCVYFDNFFSSHSLLCKLKEMLFRATGTIRENRTARCPLQPTKALEKMPRGSYDFSFDTNNEVLLVKWNDNKCVSLATNFDHVEPLATVTRWNAKEKARGQIPQPRLIHNYNLYMGGVDHHNWLLEKHSIAIRGKKWYWCLFTRMVDMVVINSFLLYRRIHGNKSVTLKDFRRQIAVPYLKLGHGNTLIKGRPLSYPSTSRTEVLNDVRFDQKGHFLEKRSNQRRCQYSSCKSRPLTYCTKCNVTLCTTCFIQYHRKN